MAFVLHKDGSQDSVEEFTQSWRRYREYLTSIEHKLPANLLLQNGITTSVTTARPTTRGSNPSGLSKRRPEKGRKTDGLISNYGCSVRITTGTSRLNIQMLSAIPSVRFTLTMETGDATKSGFQRMGA